MTRGGRSHNVFRKGSMPVGLGVSERAIGLSASVCESLNVKDALSHKVRGARRGGWLSHCDVCGSRSMTFGSRTLTPYTPSWAACTTTIDVRHNRYLPHNDVTDGDGSHDRSQIQ